MCGIVGMVSKWGNGFHGVQADVMEELLYSDGLRGMDSTGVFGVTKKNQINVLKQAVEPGLFIQTKGWKDFRGDIVSKFHIVVGHNRKATVGEIVSKTAHPFVEGNVTLVHNGFVANHKTLNNSCDVDSQAAAKHLNKEADTIKALQGIYGAYALVWYHHEKKRLFLARNNDRPLYIAENPDALFFASEDGMLEWILKRNKITINSMRLLPSHRLIEIKIDNFQIKEEAFTTTTTNPLVDRSGEALDLSAFNLGDNYPFEQFPETVDGANDHPLPELERIKKEAEKEQAKKETNGEVKAAFNHYPDSTQVLFWPRGFTPAGLSKHNKPAIDVFGEIWLPGKPSYRASWWTDDTTAKEKFYLNVRVPHTGSVAALRKNPSNGSLSFLLHNVKQATGIVKDTVGTSISAKEWFEITESVKCNQCNSPLKSWQVDACKVERKSAGMGYSFGRYDVTCAKCLTFPSVPPKNFDHERNNSDYGG